MRYYVSLGDDTVEVEVRGDRVVVDGEEHAADLASVRGTTVHSLLLDGVSHRLGARRLGRGRWELTVDGRTVEAEVLDRRGKAIRDLRRRQEALSGPAPVRAPMPGLLVKVEVEPGQEVRVGQGVAVVEAMKMENELSAPADARVSAVRASAGDSVAKDAVLVEFEPLEGDARDMRDKGEGETE